MESKILIVGAGELQVPLIQAAKAMGLFVVASDRDPEAPGFAFADHKLIADTMNPQDVLEQITAYGAPQAVITSGTDASDTVAAVAAAFNLPGHSPEAARLCTDKIAQRKALSAAGVPVPKFFAVSSPQQAADALRELGGKAVFKPADNMGARGVSLARSPEEAEAAFALAKEFSRSGGEVLAEEYVNAPELSVDSLVYQGTITITGVADRIIEQEPYFIETGHILPSGQPRELIDAALEAFCKAVQALGLRHGAAKGDIKVTPQGPVIIEVAARLSGGFMSSHTFPLATGIDLNTCALRLALGENPAVPQPSKNMVCVERALMCPSGKILSISVPASLDAAHVSIRKKAGDMMPPPKNNVDKIGNIVVYAPTRAQAIAAANKAVRRIRVAMESEQPFPKTIKAAEDRARELLKPGCTVCPECNGISCRGKIPGVGAVGTGEGFIQTYQRFREIKLVPSFVHNVRKADASVEMFGVECSLPVFPAPIAGAGLHYNGALSEWALQKGMIQGAYQAGTVNFTPDPVTYDLFGIIEDTVLQNYGNTITICKPRSDISLMRKRIERVLAAGALGVGTDLDGMGLKTIVPAEGCSAKSSDEIKALCGLSPKLFVVKGILSPSDADLLVRAGATHLVVSNHGGRINDSFPPAIDMLPAVKAAVGERAVILVDGAVRSAADIIKCLLLGADGVLIGRPCAYLSVGGGSDAVRAYLLGLKAAMESLMLMLGVSRISELKNRGDLLKDIKRF